MRRNVQDSGILHEASPDDRGAGCRRGSRFTAPPPSSNSRSVTAPCSAARWHAPSRPAARWWWSPSRPWCRCVARAAGQARRHRAVRRRGPARRRPHHRLRRGRATRFARLAGPARRHADGASCQHRSRWPTALAEHPVACTQYHGRRGHPVGFSSELYSELIALDGDDGARRLVARYPAPMALEVDDPGVLVDIDTVEDLAALRSRRAGRCARG
jgi:hypothetical protein